MQNNENEPLSTTHAMGLVARLRHIDRLLNEIDTALRASESPAAFPRLEPDLRQEEHPFIRQSVEAMRKHLLDFLEELEIARPASLASARQSMRVALVLIEITLEEIETTKLRGYGEPPGWLVHKLDGFVREFRAEVTRLHEFVRQEPLFSPQKTPCDPEAQ